MKWFKHDSNAHRDVKLKRLMMRYGLEGYGLYFYCLERITDKVSVSNLTFSLEDDAEILAHDLEMHVDDVNNMMRYMIELGLFEDSQGVITCLKLAKRLDTTMTGNPNMRKLISEVRTESGHSHDSVIAEKKRKEKKRTIGAKFTPPTVNEVREYFKSKGVLPQEEADNFFYFYESKGWMVGKNKMKNWKMAASGWISRNTKTDKPTTTQARYI